MLARIASLDNDRLWLEKVRLDTLPLVDTAPAAHHGEALADLAEILREAAGDAEFRQQLGAELLAPFTARLPHELDALVPGLAALRVGDIDALVDAVGPALLARLAGTE